MPCPPKPFVFPLHGVPCISLFSPRSPPQAISDKFGPVSLVHFDSHFDTWDEYFGEKCTHGTPFKRVGSESSSLSPDLFVFSSVGDVCDRNITQRAHARVSLKN